MTHTWSTNILTWPTWSANCSAGGNIRGCLFDLSATVAMSNLTAPSRWASLYSCSASRFHTGLFQWPAMSQGFWIFALHPNLEFDRHCLEMAGQHSLYFVGDVVLTCKITYHHGCKRESSGKERTVRTLHRGDVILSSLQQTKPASSHSCLHTPVNTQSTMKLVLGLPYHKKWPRWQVA